jgi:uncharacterized protein
LAALETATKSGCIDKMKRQEAIEHLESIADDAKNMGATTMYLYGSTARDEGRPDSDIDVFIDYDPSGKFSAFDLIGIKFLREDHFHLPVDVATRDGLHPRLRERIEQSACFKCGSFVI